MNQIPKALKYAFIFHFFADIIFAIPLFFFPNQFLEFLGWQSIDPISARLVAAALFGIGIKSLTGRHASPEVYDSMLSLKIIWSFFASAGLLYSIFANEFGNQIIGWSFFIIFFLFHLLWWFWKIKLKAWTSSHTDSGAA